MDSNRSYYTRRKESSGVEKEARNTLENRLVSIRILMRELSRFGYPSEYYEERLERLGVIAKNGAADLVTMRTQMRLSV